MPSLGRRLKDQSTTRITRITLSSLDHVSLPYYKSTVVTALSLVHTHLLAESCVCWRIRRYCTCEAYFVSTPNFCNIRILWKASIHNHADILKTSSYGCFARRSQALNKVQACAYASGASSTVHRRGDKCRTCRDQVREIRAS